MARNLSYFVRRWHRYLGAVTGIQFLFWTLGGAYFSWSNMEEVHGDHQRLPAPGLSPAWVLVSPHYLLDTLVTGKAGLADHRIQSLQLINVLDQPVYQVTYWEGGQDSQTPHEGTHQAPGSGTKRVLLADARTGKPRPPLTAEEAVALAKRQFRGVTRVEKVEYLTDVSAHHEYRESPLPAYAIHFATANRTTVFVAAELGTVQKFRNRSWRIFDWFWMLHTMDYQGRDHFGNVLLKLFSGLGLLTIASGLVLYYRSSSTVRRIKRSGFGSFSKE
jgi:uncharacterized iron-regulated membrane protein